jgi:CRISPR-associated protein Cmr5
MSVPNPGIRRTREQIYAARVLAQIQATLAVYAGEPAARKQYRSSIMSAPALVHNAGLAQALAFIASRKEPAQQRLAGDLAKAVLGDAATADTLLRRAQGDSGGLRDYIYLTRQVLEALVWFRRYAQILIPDEAPAPQEPQP